jgi:hypothetical protein
MAALEWIFGLTEGVMTVLIELIIALIALAFLCEYVDATLGMGFGTILSPALLFLGYEPMVMVPTVLFSQFLAGLVCSGFHHNFENMNLKNDQWQRTALLVFLSTGFLGVIASSLSILKLPGNLIKLYIGLVVILMGLIMALNLKMGATHSLPRLAAMGLIAAFNKGISGGGYGPIIVGGQIVSDINPRAALAIAVFVESLICLVGFTLQFFLIGVMDFILFLSVTAGAVIAAPLSAFTTRKVDHESIKWIIAIAMIIIGIATILTIVI